VGLVTPETDPDAGQKKKRYAYDPHLDPQLVWAGKAEHTSFEVPTVSLHVHERIDPRTIIEAVRKRNGNGRPVQGSLFEKLRDEPLREAIEFYQHKHGWTNRLIAGDSLLVMNSLLEKEGLAGKVQMIYIDPPYGIKYGSNFQPFVNKRDVKDGKDEDLTARAGADPRLPRHLGAGHPLLPHLPARPAAPGAGTPHRERQHLRADQRRERPPRAGVDG
jgi:adenine-specific DNA-methyltransferase